MMRLGENTEPTVLYVKIPSFPGRLEGQTDQKTLIEMLKEFSPDVFPAGATGAVVDLGACPVLFPDGNATALRIQRALSEKTGNRFRGSIGLAPNIFLAKLAAGLGRPGAMIVLTPDTIEDVLKPLPLTGLPGIDDAMADRLRQHGIRTPLDLRSASPERLQTECGSLIGWHWHMRLNFSGEIDLETRPDRTMQARRTVPAELQGLTGLLHELLETLCLTLERRMVRKAVFYRKAVIQFRYLDEKQYTDEIRLPEPGQDGLELYRIIRDRMERFEKTGHTEPVFGAPLKYLSVTVQRFMPAQLVPFSQFENDTRKNRLRQALYEGKARFGADKLLRAAELGRHPTYRDAPPPGTIRELDDDRNPF
ncbi:DNA polymerase Y family protein [Larkinella soli]|uniref:DNA polymerase Y family protein n=1 Tax=Larkinella soli TaxID=1770527 RepID=UPI000FFB2397|nr:DNA polymerase IV [Larkinella soli]